MNRLEFISEKIKKNKIILQNQYHVKEIGIFGSYVRGEERYDSDIDILVDIDKPIDLFQFLELEELLTGWTGGKVDLVSKKSLKPEIGKYILNEVQYL
jgi:predicted nucleotidyltransferase